MMNYFFTMFLFISVNSNLLFPQNINSNGIQNDSRIIDLFEDLKNRARKIAPASQNIKGSPYFDKSFKLADVEYFGKIFEDEIYLRFNAFKDEMEMTTNPKAEGSENILIKNNKVSCVLDGDIYRYLGFIEENQPPKIGYLKQLYKGNIFAFYERKTKVYMEGKIARTSLERSFPPRFVDKTKYYFSINNMTLRELKLSRKKLHSKLKPYNEKINLFLGKNKKLKSQEDFVKLFVFLEQNDF